MYDTVEKLHVNFYEDAMELDEIESRIGTAKNLEDSWTTQPLASSYRGTATVRRRYGNNRVARITERRS